ncbi:hypothetical protein CC80DRAFT_487248 [Byssothecium circinans]|uniref:Uncharacterized protein n=1 Tax=Byssothecium circinans TaxID=147558 RepID=A0A6A5UIM3_9PLEO|nr:hypothetical protein CC80DRAFT_487248 [Byssothecium circinans]
MPSPISQPPCPSLPDLTPKRPRRHQTHIQRPFAPAPGHPPLATPPQVSTSVQHPTRPPGNALNLPQKKHTHTHTHTQRERHKSETPVGEPG